MAEFDGTIDACLPVQAASARRSAVRIVAGRFTGGSPRPIPRLLSSTATWSAAGGCLRRS